MIGWVAIVFAFLVLGEILLGSLLMGYDKIYHTGQVRELVIVAHVIWLAFFLCAFHFCMCIVTKRVTTPDFTIHGNCLSWVGLVGVFLVNCTAMILTLTVLVMDCQAGTCFPPAPVQILGLIWTLLSSHVWVAVVTHCVSHA